MRGITISPIYPDTAAADARWLPVVVAVTCGTALVAGLCQILGALL